MFTAAGAVARKTRKGRTSTVRPSTNLLISSGVEDSIAAVRLQRLMPLGLIGPRADLISSLIWGEPA